VRARTARLAALAAAALAFAPGRARAYLETTPLWEPPAFAILETPALAAGAGVAAPAPAPEWAPPSFALRESLEAGAGVAAGPAAVALETERDEEPDPRAGAVAAARRLLGKPFRSDCSGFVLEAWRAANVRPRLAPARSRTESLYRATERVDAPLPGDVAFFHDTYDRNRDGKANDRFTHVALVEAVDGDAVTLLHRGVHGVERVRMDLARPDDPAANDRVRVVKKGDRRKPRVLAGELFAGYGALPIVTDVAAQ
jgi:cell wall-associated NlpC family hydrolase